MTHMEEIKIIKELFPERNFILWEDIQSYPFYNQYDSLTRKLRGMCLVTEDGRFGYGKTGLLISNTQIKSGIFGNHKPVLKYSFVSFDFVNSPEKGNLFPGITDEDFSFLKKLSEVKTIIKKRVDDEKQRQKLEEEEKEIKRLKELESSKEDVLGSLDVDNNGVLDIIEGGDFMRLLKKHQPRIKEIDRTYIQRFIQVSNFIKSQSESLQEIFTRINQVENQEELESLVGLLKNNIHTYEQILFHSLNMIVSLVDEDDLTFYEIYETFDKLNVFDSGWEKQVSQKLSDINLNISDLMYSVDRMNVQIVNGLNQLSYITEESNRNLVGQLGEIDSSIRVNNLLTGISTYQLYKINKNTKSLRG